MASNIRFIQCSGFRFDSLSWEGPEEWAVPQNQDLWRIFEEVLSICKAEKIELLFLTGDLFEQEYVRKETVERVALALSKLSSTRIFIAPGAKDPLVLTSAYRLAIWPSNVHIFSSDVRGIKIPSLNVNVYGAGWSTYHQEASFLDGFQTIEDDAIQLMVLHTKVGSEKNEGFIPISLEQIISSGLTYLAVGHQQTWSGIQQAGETFWADSGSPVTRGFSEQGTHGVIIGEMRSDSLHLEFRELSQRMFVEKIIEFNTDIEGLAHEILSETSTQEREKDFFRIKLTGTLDEVERSVLPLLKLLKDEFRFLEVIPFDREGINRRKLDADALKSSTNSYVNGFPSVAQLFFNKLQARLLQAEHSERQEHWELVHKIGLTAMDQGRRCNEN